MFRVYNFIFHHLYIPLCAHHPKFSLFPSPYIWPHLLSLSSFTLFSLPEPPFHSGNHHTVFCVYEIVGFFFCSFAAFYFIFYMSKTIWFLFFNPCIHIDIFILVCINIHLYLKKKSKLWVYIDTSNSNQHHRVRSSILPSFLISYHPPSHL